MPQNREQQLEANVDGQSSKGHLPPASTCDEESATRDDPNGAENPDNLPFWGKRKSESLRRAPVDDRADRCHQEQGRHLLPNRRHSRHKYLISDAGKGCNGNEHRADPDEKRRLPGHLQIP